MRPHIIRVANDFWNIRGSFKVAGVVDVGTQTSLVRRANGKFVFLDSYALSDAVEREVIELTGGGQDVEAIVNVHPFHTVFVRKMYRLFPQAKLYGTARHVSRFSELPWEALRTEDPALHSLFADDFEFSVPLGVDFISANEKVHFSSVMVWHRASKTIHVDDTLNYVRVPRLIRMFGLLESMSFHPTLAKALEKRAGATSEFRDWAEKLADRWRDAENLCAAHTATLTSRENNGASIHARLLEALAKVEGTLTKHRRKYG
jgi:hypothetical protein